MGEYFNISGKSDTNVNYFNNIYLWKSYLGFTPEIIEFRDSGYLSEMDEVKSMLCYPEDGSIAIVGDTVVIKASEIADKWDINKDGKNIPWFPKENNKLWQKY